MLRTSALWLSPFQQYLDDVFTSLSAVSRRSPEQGPPTLERLASLAEADVFEELGTTAAGLTKERAAELARIHGGNLLAKPPRRRWASRLGANFTHLMAILLWVGGGIALAAGLPELAFAIWVVNLINGTFSFWQEYKAERAMAALRELLPTFATVIRDGLRARIPAEELVPGDVMVLEEGDRISADGRLVDHVSLRVDQSTLTGESRPTRKASEAFTVVGTAPVEVPNLVFGGTNVVAGKGKAIVFAIGQATQLGRVASLTQATPEEPSPLQLEMRRLSVIVSVVALTVGASFFGLALWLGGMSEARGFVFALGMIVAFVPEGLLPTVTLSLAMGTQRMARRRALVKRLSAVETLGSTSVICTDKTGTLTQNEMTVRAAATTSSRYRFSGVGYNPDGGVDPIPDSLLEALLRTAALASNARLVPPDDEGGRWSAVGDPTEAAILVAAQKAGVGPQDGATRVGELPFDAQRKRMSTLDRINGELVLDVKGAPLELLERSQFVATANGTAELDPRRRKELEGLMNEFAASGLRVLGVASRGMEAVPARFDPAELERELVFIGLLAMHDPPRPEVEQAIATCRRAGIRIVMITGDHGLTAQTIGQRIGMVGESVRVVTGSELDLMDETELAAVLGEEVLFARATPEHKLRIVAALQDLGAVVAVTGDGVNDAPALKRADIGVAMGMVGTDVAREAADMILLDDNFASIVAAVEEGRAVYSNIRKFTTYILTSNTPEAVPFIAFAFSGGAIPIALDVMHILAIDLGTDLAPALALGAEPPEPGLMDRAPRLKSQHVIDRRLLTRSYLWLGPLQAAFVMAAFFGAYRLLGYQGLDGLPSAGTDYMAATAMALAAVVTTQIGNLFAQRSETVSLFRTGLGGNRLLWWGILSEVAIVAVFTYLPFFNDVIGTAPFPPQGWLWLLLGIPLLPLIDEVRKYSYRRRIR